MSTQQAAELCDLLVPYNYFVDAIASDCWVRCTANAILGGRVVLLETLTAFKSLWSLTNTVMLNV